MITNPATSQNKILKTAELESLCSSRGVNLSSGLGCWHLYSRLKRMQKSLFNEMGKVLFYIMSLVRQ
jgi:hypothetical protein